MIARNWLRVLRGSARGVYDDLEMMEEWSARFGVYRNDLSLSGRFLGPQRTSGIEARRAGTKFNHWTAATENQIWQ
jgi:hypothetical protein